MKLRYICLAMPNAAHSITIEQQFLFCFREILYINIANNNNLLICRACAHAQSNEARIVNNSIETANEHPVNAIYSKFVLIYRCSVSVWNNGRLSAHDTWPSKTTEELFSYEKWLSTLQNNHFIVSCRYGERSSMCTRAKNDNDCRLRGCIGDEVHFFFFSLFVVALPP